MIALEDLRIRLDQTSERIVSRMKDRSRMPLNPSVYVPDAVPIKGREGISFLQFAIEGMETYHASLGRYEYRDQHPILSRALPESAIARAETGTELAGVEIKLTDDMLTFYKGLLPDLCSKKGDEPKTYGETVYIDADLLELMHERINTIGRYVAHTKFTSNPKIVEPTNDNEIRQSLRDLKREDAVVERAKEMAGRYSLEPNVTERCFRWLIRETVEVEVVYLKSFGQSAPKTKITSS